MQEKILPHIDKAIYRKISEIAAKENNEVYLVGGFVRDILLDRTSKDVDIMVVGSGITLAEKVCDAFPEIKKTNVFKSFGTAMLIYHDLQIEFVGARKESYRKDSRKPIVEDGSFLDDISRRDFTINSLSISLNKDSFGSIIDVFGGISDIENKIIRTPLDPDITYSDDPLRMLRAIRFASELDFTIEEKSYYAIKRNAKRIEIISQERISDEINKILLSKTPSKGLLLLDKLELLEYILPELSALKGVENIEGKAHKEIFLHSLQVLDKIALQSDNLWLRWAALIHDIGKAPTKAFDKKIGWTFHGHEYVGKKMVRTLFKRLKLPQNESMKYVQKLVGLHLRPIALVEDSVTDSAIRRLLFEAGNDIEDLMMLCKADITSKNDLKIKKYIRNFEHVREKMLEIEEKDRVRNWQPPIDGKEIMEYFGIGACREIGILKNAIKEAILEGTIPNNYDAAFSFMLEKAKELNIKKK
jgi:poly(A) polymerase